ncbi:penicillin-binding protein 1A [Megalodesulfovibrio gigas]|uniref:Penicillin-binding protein 1A n=1 Tax=Megalodesulfovibrio gigas (strain ATCC 19364 / DSM 1382 / NCIMB 9332 / VKM B-1759) TaxID=1121448 RepID=T2GA29_MEGG1|nr:PBP1A family penicillin-binding protein [Megalodesulfovibrio gigas]AGW13123.1 putative penicillin-binding, 1A family protein [Megalodesulfovibrio gigas DSM 1382 = ATCC 19364]
MHSTLFLRTVALLAALTVLAAPAGLAHAQQATNLSQQTHLPEFDKVMDYRPPLVTMVYARDGELMGMFGREKRFLAPLAQIPAHVVNAFLAAEDSAFYEHEGVDLQAIFRAFSKNVAAGGIVQGASTITQQVIKRLLLTSEKSYIRKAKEAILAYRLERRLTKNEILSIYLNDIFLGAGAYGVEAAARIYFGKHVTDLTLSEGALLAGLPKAPTTYNPYHDPKVAKERQQYVLGRMLELTWITQEEHDAALAAPLEYRSMEDPTFGRGAYYLEEVRRTLIASLTADAVQAMGFDTNATGEEALYTLGLQVFTSMDMQHQIAAEDALRRGLEDATRRAGWKGPVKTVTPDRFDEFLAGDGALPPNRLPQGPVLALVVRVNAEGAEVQLGQQKKGRIPAASISWARKARGPAGSALAVGDVIWVTLDEPAQFLDPTVSHAACTMQPIVKIQGALVSMEPNTGDVTALVGGYDFHESSFNRATQAQRQPGSSFKPIVYSAAMDNGFTPASVLYDRPISIWDAGSKTLWEPKNYSNKFYGPTLLTTGLALSRNLVTIQVADRIGMNKVAERARDLGLGEHPAYLSVALGSQVVTPINLVQAYTAFANGGVVSSPRLMASLADNQGRQLRFFEPQLRQAISPQNAYIMANMLKHVVLRGTATKARVLNRPLAGKTGTTNEERDAWFLGFAPYLVSGVYVGYDDYSPMGKQETGARAALPIWIDYRQQVEGEYPVKDFPVPEGIVTRTVYDVGEHGGRSFELAFIAGQEHGGASYDAETAMYYDEMYGSEEGYSGTEGGSRGGTAGSRQEEELLKQLF